ncbi:MAG: CPBP family intramembrane metalloprotease [Defluviitaleaceae bacterium]|nr:CPBP family intramembrane metalloprotease [Defluviitaleaceae bacterium]
MTKSNKRRDILTVAIVFVFTLVALLLVGWVNGIARGFPLAMQLILMTAAWWPMLAATIFFMRRDKEGLGDIGFSKENIPMQILLGVPVAAVSLFIFIALPGLFGFQMGFHQEMNPLTVVLEFVRILLSVALVEEIIFRGHIFKKLQDINNSKWFAILISSVLFGLFHILNWNPLQIVVTTIIGIYWCLCRDRFKHCTLLTLIVAHALHNLLIPVVTGFFF